MSTAFCGRGKIPKGKHSGSAAECMESGQVRKWGEKKVPARLLAATKPPDLEALRQKANIMVQRARKLNKDRETVARTLRSENTSKPRRKRAEEQMAEIEAEYARIKAAVPSMKEKIADAERKNKAYDDMLAEIAAEEKKREKKEKAKAKAKEKSASSTSTKRKAEKKSSSSKAPAKKKSGTKSTGKKKRS